MICSDSLKVHWPNWSPSPSTDSCPGVYYAIIQSELCYCLRKFLDDIYLPYSKYGLKVQVSLLVPVFEKLHSNLKSSLEATL